MVEGGVSIVRMWFPTRHDVIAWICENQLSRQGLIEENRRYLIGMQYNAKRAAAEEAHDNRDKDGKNSYQVERHIAETLGTKYGISSITVRRNGRYSHAVDVVEEKVPGFRQSLLSGDYKLSVDNMIKMPDFSIDQINVIIARLEEQKRLRHRQAPHLRNASLSRYLNPDGPSGPSVKDMPSYDPDAEITALTLTVPSWINSIKRALRSAEQQPVSRKAKENVKSAMAELQTQIAILLSTVGDEP